MSDAMEFLDRVKDRAKELYAMSDQGEWDDLDPFLQKFWIDHAAEQVRNGEDRFGAKETP